MRKARWPGLWSNVGGVMPRRISRGAFGAAVAGLAVLCAGCGIAGAAGSHPSQSHHQAIREKPFNILATSAGTASATAPLPNGDMWVLAGSTASKGLFEVNVGSGNKITSVSVSNAGVAVAATPTGLVGLGQATSTTGSITFYNGSSGSQTGTVALSGPVYSVAAGSDGTTFYVLNGTTKARVVTVVNGQKDAIIGAVPAPSDAVAVVPSPGEHNVYVLEPNGTVSEIAVANGQLVTQFSVGKSGRALALSPAGTILYVLKGRGAARNVAVVNLATEVVTKVLPAPADTQGIVLSPTGTTLYDIVGTGSYGNIQSYHV